MFNRCQPTVSCSCEIGRLGCLRNYHKGRAALRIFSKILKTLPIVRLQLYYIEFIRCVIFYPEEEEGKETVQENTLIVAADEGLGENEGTL